MSIKTEVRAGSDSGDGAAGPAAQIECMWDRGFWIW